ncbi:hypothetical protein DFH01_09880 [Falsiroseomonas bella]|uniref:Uncharacterized protein n=1 Tax=Falsiroseomonas bella TaxID=2184016 RepID=A0A317FF40_9PROT|nr:hypothetical protein [Falsiroseomonas bella]PWS37163.1 hypothetical protein DFH01_09880 [Falsiroseomonas bella]
MSAAFVAALLCSVAAFIHTRSSDPAMRPANAVADLVWKGLAFAALIAWGVLIVRDYARGEWADGTAALLGSIAANWYFNHRGPRPAWPGLSMLFAVVGLGLAAWSFINE